MKTIVITLQVPDGVNVQVNGGGQPARAPQPQYPGGSCPEHGEDWKLVPAGVSRTKVDENGQPKRFNAFWVCPVRDCPQKPSRPSVVEDVTMGFEEQMPF